MYTEDIDFHYKNLPPKYMSGGGEEEMRIRITALR